MKPQVSIDEVFLFKGSHCDENSIIARIIEQEIRKEHEPILDVGFGVGDIVYRAMKNLKVIGIDVNLPDVEKFPLRKGHERIKIDFFKYDPVFPITTLFISHTLQFLDYDIERLNSKVKSLNPHWIICVMNKNDDFLGEVIAWSQNAFFETHPEVHHADFPKGYKMTKSIPFTARLGCASFQELASQIRYLLLVDSSEDEGQIQTYLSTKLKEPTFTINQEIIFYEKK